MGARCDLTGTDAPPTLTDEISAAAGRRSPEALPRNSRRSLGAKRRSRRRPTRRAGSRPESLQRRIAASLTLRNWAASRVLSRLLLAMTLILSKYSIAHH